MRQLSWILAAMAAGTFGWAAGEQAAAQERGPIIAFGETRAQLQATPIEQRPYRPLHFYGNTVRRRLQRAEATTAPTPTPSVYHGSAATYGPGDYFVPDDNERRWSFGGFGAAGVRGG